eukprot:403374519
MNQITQQNSFTPVKSSLQDIKLPQIKRANDKQFGLKQHNQYQSILSKRFQANNDINSKQNQDAKKSKVKSYLHGRRVSQEYQINTSEKLLQIYDQQEEISRKPKDPDKYSINSQYENLKDFQSDHISSRTNSRSFKINQEEFQILKQKFEQEQIENYEGPLKLDAYNFFQPTVEITQKVGNTLDANQKQKKGFSLKSKRNSQQQTVVTKINLEAPQDFLGLDQNKTQRKIMNLAEVLGFKDFVLKRRSRDYLSGVVQSLQSSNTLNSKISIKRKDNLKIMLEPRTPYMKQSTKVNLQQLLLENKSSKKLDLHKNLKPHTYSSASATTTTTTLTHHTAAPNQQTISIMDYKNNSKFND